MPTTPAKAALAVLAALFPIAAASEISVKDFGAKGDYETDDTASINSALEAAFNASPRESVVFPCGAYRISDDGHVGYALLNKGVSMIGQSKLCAALSPSSSTDSTSSLILLHPPADTPIDFMEVSGLFVCPRGASNAGAPYGGTGFYALFDTAVNLSRLSFKRNYFCAGNDYSAQFINLQATNAQGVPSNSDFEENSFFDGVKFTGAGDNINFSKNVVRSSAASRRPCLNANVTTASGTAGNFTIERNNMDCDGGAIYMTNARNVRVLNNNIEMTSGNGTAGGSVVDLDGSYGSIVWADISNNAIGIMPSAGALLSSAVRVNAAAGTRISHNTIISGRASPVPYGVLINESASSTWLSTNQIQPAVFTMPVSDSGTSTSGVSKYLSLESGFSNFGGAYLPLGWVRDGLNSIVLSGRMKAPKPFGNGTIFSHLPLGHRPLGDVVCPVVGNTGSARPVAAAVEIAAATGALSLRGPTTLTDFTITGCSFPTLGHVPSGH